jgi:hypothetical protein
VNGGNTGGWNSIRPTIKDCPGRNLEGILENSVVSTVEFALACRECEEGKPLPSH